ncbi:MAG TPA: glycerol-3-phosphate dehydrogenase/oxidase [Candidatus Limnocylindrales bacterium]|nr:glycerol-3-phosphate dehydrogenase/oxidase [Candidatus Limnocylindrales bacterium]
MRRFAVGDVEGRTFDIAVIGGGITGASTAREAALRGLTVALVEKEDFSSGTSSRSTKLLHGGVRYLESYEFKLVREACRERELMLKLAPHLTKVRPFVYVLYKGCPESMLLLNAGLTLYDLFSGSPLKRRHHMLGRKALLAYEPHLNPEGLLGGGQYFDFLTDDARFTVDTVKGAVEAGAVAANYVQVTGLAMRDGRVGGVEVTDRITGERGTVLARQVINTAGVWVDEVRGLEAGVSDRILRPTKGIHIVVRKRDYPLEHAVFLRSPRDNRVVWPIPAIDEDLVYIGTTDTDYDGPLDHVTATPGDIDYLLEAANFAIPDAHLGPEHIVATWAGLRPLARPASAVEASKVSREHQILVSDGGLLTIVGGKLTTARVMGEQVVDSAVTLLGKHFGIRGVPRSRSASVPISGGDRGAVFLARRRVRELPIDRAIQQRWLSLFGGNANHLVDVVTADPATGADLGVKELTLAEVRYAVQGEMAMTLTDFFTRRASIFYWMRDGGLSVADAVATEMAALLGWSDDERSRQVAAYRAWVDANRFEPVAV